VKLIRCNFLLNPCGLLLHTEKKPFSVGSEEEGVEEEGGDEEEGGTLFAFEPALRLIYITNKYCKMY
jgi:hypothetical protein